MQSIIKPSFYENEVLHCLTVSHINLLFQVVDPLSEMRKIESFLNVDPAINASNFWFSKEKGFYCLQTGTTRKCLGPSKGRKHPKISSPVLLKLKSFYRPFNAQFAALANVSFPWLLR
jgi:hypothetical protein